MLSPAELPRYLIERGLLPAAAVLAGDLVVRDVSSRNADHVVASQRWRSLFVKQARDPASADLLAREARWYAVLAPQLPEVMPSLVDWDTERGVLVLSLVGTGQDVRELHLKGLDEAPEVGAAMGRTLGVLHRTTERSTDRTAGPDAFVPGVLMLHRPGPEVFRDTSAAALQVIRTVQTDPGLSTGLDELRQQYRTHAVIHHDAKWDNFVVERPGGAGRLDARLVDWELAGEGDPAWDVGSVLAGYLSSWIFSIGDPGGRPLVDAVAHAGRPLRLLHAAVQAFWMAYVTTAGLPAEQAPAAVLRAVRFCAARLVQTAYESAQLSEAVSGSGVLHLQLASNVLDRPADAAARLLHLSPTVGVAAPGVQAAVA